MAEKLITIGEIIRHQGNKGEVRVKPLTDFIERFEMLDRVYLVKNRIKKEVYLEDVWYHKQFVILKFEGFDGISEAIDHKGYLIQIAEEEKVELAEDDYYVDEIIGIEVYTKNGEYLGTLQEVLETGANDVYIVNNDGEELLLPAIKDVILNVDLSEQKMVVKLLPGLR
ncbi:16S rRNA processing protein RimM [Orenia metallireducens]|jgi:16S rRNA processing protein RimM|uniref:Ribosome maturation factor RimM n=1 Tax=Orenia metallireducens TaxID=1413210 RepID=A0A285HJH6_9FIRM|nr:ribosome maturation factor RimM [Orenia metallireducens]PRX26659.1 16S rRNA processing protein RimM [Orenia metallireducens]SNY35910.1 16S rRNA processing protein RimM [Orenia metallireducens]